MPLTREDCAKIGQAVAAQLYSVAGGPATEEPKTTAQSTRPSLAEMEADFKENILPEVKDFVADLKAHGYLPAGKAFGDAVIVIA